MTYTYSHIKLLVSKLILFISLKNSILSEAQHQERFVMSKTKERKVASEKWGGKVMDVGYCIIPSILLRAQQRLGLNPTHLAIILQLADHWWEPERKPYPSKSRLSERLGIKERQIQRYIAELEQGGFVKRIAQYNGTHNGRMPNKYDLSGLVQKLKELEPEFTELAKQNKENNRQISKRGGLKNAAKN
jgi:hypothetical protein